MAKRFLTHIDLAGNQIINAAFEKLSTDPTTGNFEGRIYYNTAEDILRVYDGSAWVSVGAITDVQGTTNEVEVSVVDGVATIGLPSTVNANTTGNAATATALQTGRTISLSGDVAGSVSFDGTGNVDITTTVQSDSVALGTDTTGDYVATVTGTTNQVSVTGSGTEGREVTLSTPQDIHTEAEPTFAGATLGEVQVGVTGDNEIDTATGNLTIDSAGGTVTVDDDLVVTGDLTVSGTTTTINTETINLADNIITLNSNATGSASENAGIEVERGDDTNVTLRWNETSDTWEATRDGSNYAALLLDGDDLSANEIVGFQEDVEDVVAGLVSGSNSVSVTYADNAEAAGDLVIDATLATTSYLSKASGLAVDIATLEAKLVTDSFTKKATASVGNGTNTSFAVTHSLGTRDVQVQIYDNATYDTVEADVTRTDANTVTVSFTLAPATDAYRVVVIG